MLYKSLKNLSGKFLIALSGTDENDSYSRRCNIYIRQQETSTVRDIFMAPFSARLVACVVAVAVLAASAVVLISRLAPSVRNRARPMEYAEALIWSTGILCQQGLHFCTT